MMRAWLTAAIDADDGTRDNDADLVPNDDEMCVEEAATATAVAALLIFPTLNSKQRAAIAFANPATLYPMDK